jgi:hypothetical protein
VKRMWQNQHFINSYLTISVVWKQNNVELGSRRPTKSLFSNLAVVLRSGRYPQKQRLQDRPKVLILLLFICLMKTCQALIAKQK